MGWTVDFPTASNPYTKRKTPTITALVNGQEVPFEQAAALISGGGLAGSYQTAYNEAKAANEARYTEILGGYGDLYKRAMGLVTDQGEQQRQDLRQQWLNAQSSGMQDLVSRGMAGTTVAPTMKAMYLKGMNADVNRLNESLRQEQLQTDVGLSQAQLGFQERRTDAYPDYNQMAALAGGVGAAGGGTFGLANANAVGNANAINYPGPLTDPNWKNRATMIRQAMQTYGFPKTTYRQPSAQAVSPVRKTNQTFKDTWLKSLAGWM